MKYSLYLTRSEQRSCAFDDPGYEFSRALSIICRLVWFDELVIRLVYLIVWSSCISRNLNGIFSYTFRKDAEEHENTLFRTHCPHSLFDES